MTHQRLLVHTKHERDLHPEIFYRDGTGRNETGNENGKVLVNGTGNGNGNGMLDGIHSVQECDNEACELVQMVMFESVVGI